MVLLTAENIKKAYGERVILKDVSLYINDTDKIGIVGVNGEGKSTLLKILAGELDCDGGEITPARNLRIAYLPQTPVFKEGSTALEAMECEKNGADEFEAKRILTKLGINDFDRKTELLSGGQRKRVAIARALSSESNLLILDEPTNHLDSEMIIWLENFLKAYKGAIIMITHDRYFLDRVTNRIAEVDRGELYLYETNYSGFIEEKSARLEAARSAEKKRQAFLRREVEWVRRGVLARGTKSKARLDNYERIKNQEGLHERQKLELSSMNSRLGKKIIEINGISKSYDGNTLIRDFSYNMLRNDRIGVVGSNGTGKSTLLKMIAGMIEPDTGSIDRGETVKIGYFSQESEAMDLSMRVIDYVKEAGEYIETPEGTISAAKLLERFLFDGEAQWSTIGRLSGGERRRLELMRVLMTAPNILLLDEPTNDLDIETLCILEEYIENFAGAVIAVSHDRYFLDKISTQIFELAPYGEIKRYPGNYSDYEEKRVEYSREAAKPKEKTARTVRESKPKFTFKEQREYETIDDDIAALEEKIASIDKEMAECATDFTRLNELANEKTELEEKLEEKTERWVYLNEKAEEIEAYKNNR
ncbi:MAG: ABC-F family ATP-binding cassette domain-containing protein [Candidatus Ornithomonoglobus sp.]